jgi:hypothetical protein
VGYLYRNRAFTGLIKKSDEAACQEVLGECLWDVFECLGGQCCVRGSVLWGTLKGIHGGTWARRPWTVLVSCSRTAGWTASAVAALGRECIAEIAKSMVQWF